MWYREDYYKFTHFLMPKAIFDHGQLIVYRLLRNEELFIENLKKMWSDIEVEKPELRNEPPEFKLHIVNFNVEHTGIIITVPGAIEEQEAVYVGITYDKDDNFRYFTYEIGKGSQRETVYFTCECTAEMDFYNYGFHDKVDKSLFIEDLSNLLVYDLL